MKIRPFSGLILILFSPTLFAANITAVQDGNWSTSTTWDLGRTPQDNDVVTIPSARQVFFTGSPYPKNTPTIRPTLNIKIYGILDFSGAGNDKLYLDMGSVIQLYAGAKIQTSTSSAEIIAIYDGSVDNTVWTGSPNTVNGPSHATATTMGFSNAVLPVKLQSFVIKKSNDSFATLTWITIDEYNSSLFEIESLNASTGKWKLTGQVHAAGSSSAALEYNYVVSLVAGVNQFRLKQIDNDGKFIYSPIVSLDYIKDRTIKVDYNQRTRQLSVNGPETISGVVSIYDLSGHILYLGNIVSPIIFTPKTSGVYVVNVSNNTSHTAHKIFIY